MPSLQPTPPALRRLAVLDDYQHVAESLADWDALRARGVELTFFHEHLGHGPASVAAALAGNADAPGFDAILAMRERTVFDAAVLALLPQLRLLVTTGRRNKSIDLAAAAAQGVTVCGTDASAAGAPELTWALMLAALRGIPGADAGLRAGRWQGTLAGSGTSPTLRPTPLGREAAGLTLGIVGLGRIGSMVARYAHAFGMDVVAWSPHLTQERAAAAGARLAPSLEALAARSHVLTLHLQPAPSTHGIVTEQVLRALGPDGLFVNTARSSLVDMAALGRGLHEGWLGGAALDVYDVEPLTSPDQATPVGRHKATGHHATTDHLLSWPRTVLTPHLGYVTEQAYRVFFPQAVEDVLAYLDGEPVRRLS